MKERGLIGQQLYRTSTVVQAIVNNGFKVGSETEGS